jgi:hypothetical protein
MTTVGSSASVRFGQDQETEVDSSLHLTGGTYIYCHTYDDHPPILSITDTHVKVSVTVPESARVTDQDLACARRLAEAAARYVAELEKCAASDGENAAGPDAAGSEKAAGKAA